MFCTKLQNDYRRKQGFCTNMATGLDTNEPNGTCRGSETIFQQQMTFPCHRKLKYRHFIKIFPWNRTKNIFSQFLKKTCIFVENVSRLDLDHGFATLICICSYSGQNMCFWQRELKDERSFVTKFLLQQTLHRHHLRFLCSSFISSRCLIWP